MPPSWTSVQPDRQVGRRVELLVDDRPLADGWPDRREAAAAQRVEELVERPALDHMRGAVCWHCAVAYVRDGLRALGVFRSLRGFLPRIPDDLGRAAVRLAVPMPGTSEPMWASP